MEREKSWEMVTKTGEIIRKGLNKLFSKYDLNFSIFGLPAITSFKFQSNNNLAYKTLISQEMLKQGFLAGTSIYVCTEHSEDIIGQFFQALEPTIGLIKECESGRSVLELLEGPVCHSGFKRLN